MLKTCTAITINWRVQISSIASSALYQQIALNPFSTIDVETLSDTTFFSRLRSLKWKAIWCGYENRKQGDEI